MININELRIGSLLTVEGKIIKVGKIEENSISWNTSRFEKLRVWNPYISVNDQRINPILLTEEWLLNFGFNKDYKKGYIGKDFSNQDFVLTEPFVMGDWQKGYAFEFTTGGWSKYKEFNYVHELQNFYFALTGEELTQVSEGKNKNFV